jgi:hypothetical protein
MNSGPAIFDEICSALWAARLSSRWLLFALAMFGLVVVGLVASRLV